MRDAENIQLDEIAIHILEPLGQGLVLSELALPLEDGVLRDYFNGHIQTSLRDGTARAARFCSIAPERASGVCAGLLSGREGLVEGSRLLAQSLYRIMEDDRRISPADLAVGFFRAENYPGERFLALLKINPSRVFRHVIRQDPRGYTYVSFEVEREAFTSERLQKCAFIHTLEPRDATYDMLLLDRQARGEEGRVARFFSETFLDTEPALDPREFTRRLYRSLVAAQNKVRLLLDYDGEQNLEQHIHSAMTSDQLDLDAWLGQLPFEEKVVGQIDAVLRENLPDRVIQLDPGYSENRIAKVRYAGDYSLKFEVQADFYRQVVVSETLVDNDPAREPFYRIVIETDTWRKVAR